MVPWHTPIGPATLAQIDFNNYEESLYSQGIEIVLWEQADQDYADSLYYKTPFQPLSCMQNNQFRLFSNNLYKEIEINNGEEVIRYGRTNKPEIYFRVRAILKRTDGKGEPVIFIATYNVKDPVRVGGDNNTCDLYMNGALVTDISQLLGNTSNSYNFYATNYSTSSDPAWHNMLDFKADILTMTSPNTYSSGSYFAKNEVVLTGTPTQPLLIPGNTTIYAGKKINVGANVIISPDATLKLATYPYGYGCEEKQHPEGFETVMTFCQDTTKYKPLYNKTESNPVAETNSSDFPPLYASVNPNPANNAFNLSFDQPMEAEVVIWITDIMGRIVQQRKVYGANETILVSSINLANGLYFVNISTGERQWVEKVMVSH